MWCALDPDSTEDLKSFSELIEAGRSAASQSAAEFRFPTLPPAQPADLVDSLRWYVAARLVIEGGFDPDWIRPRPPITVERDRDGLFLCHDPDAASPQRQTLLGGLNDAKPDVSVTIPTIGPVLALSLEGTESVAIGPGGVPELTGDLERTAGACVNVHMMHPALVYGFWHVVSANRVQDLTVFAPMGGLDDHGDHALRTGGEPAAGLQHYHDALARLSEREDIRDAPSCYEACALTLVQHGAGPGIASPLPTIRHRGRYSTTVGCFSGCTRSMIAALLTLRMP